MEFVKWLEARQGNRMFKTSWMIAETENKKRGWPKVSRPRYPTNERNTRYSGFNSYHILDCYLHHSALLFSRMV